MSNSELGALIVIGFGVGTLVSAVIVGWITVKCLERKHKHH